MRELGFDKKLMSFSKQNRKEKLEFYSFCVWTVFLLLQNSPGKQHCLAQASKILQAEEIIYVFGDLS